MSGTPIKDFIKKFDEPIFFIISIVISALLISTLFKFLAYIDNNAKESNCSFIKETVDSNTKLLDGLCISKKDDKVYIYSKYGTEIKRKELIVE